MYKTLKFNDGLIEINTYLNDQNEIEELIPSIDTRAFIDLHLSPARKLNKLVEDLHWSSEIGEELQNILGLNYIQSDNSYNSENDLSNDINLTIVSSDSDWIYANKTYLIIQVHRGGDIRGNYENGIVYEWDGDNSIAFLDFMVGWSLSDAQGNYLYTYTIGYNNNPTNNLMKDAEKIEFDDKNQEFIFTIDGKKYIGYPYCNR